MILSGLVDIKGRAFTVQGEPLLLATGTTTQSGLPLVVIATENDTLLTNITTGKTLKESGTLELVASTLNRGENAPTVFRYIGETEKNLGLAGIGFTRLTLVDTVKADVVNWRATSDVQFDGRVIETSIGNVIQAVTQLSTTLPSGDNVLLESITYSVVLD